MLVSLKGPQLVQFPEKVLHGSLQAFDHQGPNDIGMLEAALHLVEQQYAVGRDELGPVDQGEAFLGPQLQRLETGLLKEFRAGDRLSPIDHLTKAQERKEEVG